MAVQDKTDFRWNGKLSGAVNNLYYDLINVDVVHTPYSTMHRNSSFFLKTRLWFVADNSLKEKLEDDDVTWYDITDVKIIWDSACEKKDWTVYCMVRSGLNKYIYRCEIENWCLSGDWTWLDWNPYSVGSCSDWRFFVSKYSNWENIAPISWDSGYVVYDWIQINKIELWTTYWYLSTKWIEDWDWDEFNRWTNGIQVGDYVVVTNTSNWATSWISWERRQIVWLDDTGTRLLLDAPWSWLSNIDLENATIEKEAYWYNVTFRIIRWEWENVWFTDDKNLILVSKDNQIEFKYRWWGGSKIIWVTEAWDKVFVLLDNWYIHYNTTWWYDKFLLSDSMDAWVDKSAITSYRDIILAFGNRQIAVWVPDDNNKYWTMYNQSTTIWTWSRYSFAEHDWDIVFVSNDKRLMDLAIDWSVWRYALKMQDIWQMLNSKLSTMFPDDEVFVWSYNNNLRVFVQTKQRPYYIDDWEVKKDTSNNSETHIYKFDTLFQIWSEDHVEWMLMSWVTEWLWYWKWWAFLRKWYKDIASFWGWDYVKSIINAYLIENEWTAQEWQPDLFTLAKLNKLITVLWPGIYTDKTKIHIQSYWQWIWLDYYFPVNNTQLDDDWNVISWNKWVEMISRAYDTWWIRPEPVIDDCLLQAIQDSQTRYNPKCTDSDKIGLQTLLPDEPWCDGKKEYTVQDHWVCVNDSLYRFAPTMPLVTSLGENQNYSTQIKIELTSEEWDIVCFGGWLAELFIAPIWITWADWEYELSPETEC